MTTIARKYVLGEEITKNYLVSIYHFLLSPIYLPDSSVMFFIYETTNSDFS